MATRRNQTFGSMSPRQKMINLMYIVLTAMLALNVSSDVLNGFNAVEQGLERTNRTLAAHNQGLMGELQAFAAKYPKAGQQWLDQGTRICNTTDSLYAYIDSLKLMIVRAADGPTGRLDAIKNLENLDAASQVMLPPTGHRGQELKQRVEAYRKFVTSYLDNPEQVSSVNKALSTAAVRSTDGTVKAWEVSISEGMPVIAAVTMLSKLQNDVLFSQGVVLNAFLGNLDTGELRVNEISAFVVPQSRMVMRGSKYSANIMVAAIDTLQRPRVYVNGRQLTSRDGLYEVSTSATGNFQYSGYVEVVGRDGTVTKRDFKSSYTVIEPMATVSATMMNVFYAGIDNPVSIAVAGVPAESIQATMTNGTLSKTSGGWVASTMAIGKECTITVTAEIDGQRTNVGSTSFRVRKLPDPRAFIAYKGSDGNPAEYKGGKPFAKATLLSASGLDAAIDDDLLKINYSVVSFDMIIFDQMGNAMSEKSDGARFSERQRAAMRNMRHGRRFYFSRIRATGPDHVVRDIAPLDVIVN